MIAPEIAIFKSLALTKLKLPYTIIVTANDLSLNTLHMHTNRHWRYDSNNNQYRYQTFSKDEANTVALLLERVNIKYKTNYSD